MTHSNAWKSFLFCIFLFFFSSVAVISEEQQQQNTSSVHCYVHRGIVRCGKAEDPVLNAGQKRWPNVLGIGPSKTGTTYLFIMLEKHNNVSAGDSTLGGQACCGMELYMLDQPDKVNAGLSYYGNFFQKQKYAKNAKWFIEKTPHYSSSTIAPYLARALLPQNTKLIFTVREVLNKDISLYYYRNTFGRYKADYIEWLQPRINGYKHWITCRESAFQNLLIADSNDANTWSTLDDLLRPEVFSWEAAGMVESHLYEKCGDGEQFKGPFTFPNDHFQELLYAENLRRWVNVFGTDNVLCIHSEDYRRDPVSTQKVLSDFLELSDEGWNGYIPQVFEEISPIKKLRDQFGTEHLKNARKMLLDTLQFHTSEYTDEMQSFMARICPRMDQNTNKTMI